jgi:hypothetical protein
MGMGIAGVLTGLQKNPAGRSTYDSLVEKRYMESLEENPHVRSWTKEHGIRIPYQFFMMRRTYWPDFLVELKDGSREIHETKGDGLMYWLTTHAKREAAERWCREHKCIYRLVTPARALRRPRLRIGAWHAR